MEQKPHGFAQGRPPIFTEAKALVVLKNRILAGTGTRLKDFIAGEAAEGNMPAAVSIPTLNNLLSGRMFPTLVDPETGTTFDYSRVPKSPMGRPSRFNEDGIDPVTKERRRGIPPLRQWLLDKTLDDARRIVDARIAGHYVALVTRVESLERRVADLTNVAK